MNASGRLPKVTIVGAGNVGANTALLLLLKGLANVVLVDVAGDLARGKALDLMHMRSNEQFGPTVIGTDDYDDTADSDIVVITAGLPRRPGMTREDLLDANAGIVRSVLNGALAASPDALFLFVTNPLDVMVNLAYALAGLPSERLFGMGGVLDTARFVHAISEATNSAPADIEALVIGAHGTEMVPLPRLATVEGTPLIERLDTAGVERVVEETVGGGAAVVELLKTGSAFYAPASSVARMVAELLRPSGAILSVCARLEGHYGISDVYMCVPAILGTRGVERIVELELDAEELAALRNSANSIKAQLAHLL
ncbi:MAG: malate dehydrogenase [Coriobacteriales bacterium]|jgi:malate dehydrogenase|nr:malate dehydrogenase [Coriobacteriales bacterium]